jgi:cytochrome oxidase Cu insertion factor (SCO1/SenC/PrrC family)
VVAAVLACAAPAFAAPPASKAHTGHAYAPPDPASLGGSFVLRDPAGRMVASQNLRGRWTFLYIGYSRCTDTCPVAIPTIVTAANDLNSSGVAARAVFVDIEPPPASIRPRNPALAASETSHHDPLSQQAAMDAIIKRFGPSLLVLTGSRSQLNALTAAFQIQREHVPARPRETGHSIYHSSYVFAMNPKGEVVRYFGHDVNPDELAKVARSQSGDGRKADDGKKAGG